MGDDERGGGGGASGSAAKHNNNNNNNYAFGVNAEDPKTAEKNASTTDLLPPPDRPGSDEKSSPSSPTVVVADEVIGGDMDEDAPRAFNLYRNKKLISHGMMNVALFSANANQLRYVFETSDGSAVYVICVVLLLVSIFLQILVGVALLLSARYNVTNCDQRKMAFRLGNYVIVGIFLVTVVNIFITSFGGPTIVPPAPPSMLPMQSDPAAAAAAAAAVSL